jgi:hypothetical protein
MNEILDELIEEGCFIADNSEKGDVCRQLVKDGLALCCDSIPHSHLMLNPSYTYVTNDERGKELATKALFTHCAF